MVTEARAYASSKPYSAQMASASSSVMQEVGGCLGVLGARGNGTGVHDGLVRVVRAGAGDLYAVVAVDVGGVHEADDAVAGRDVLGRRTDLVGLHDLARDGVGVRAALALLVAVQPDACERLVGVLARGHRARLADGDVAVDRSHVLERADFYVGALAAHDHEVVHEHVLTGGLVYELALNGVVHGACARRDENIDRSAAAHLLDEVARALVLRVGKRHAGLLGVERLDLGHGLLERVSRKDLKLNGLGGVGSRSVGRTRGRGLGRAAGNAGHERQRAGNGGGAARKQTCVHNSPFVSVILAL